MNNTIEELNYISSWNNKGTMWSYCLIVLITISIFVKIIAQYTHSYSFIFILETYTWFLYDSFTVYLSLYTSILSVIQIFIIEYVLFKVLVSGDYGLFIYTKMSVLKTHLCSNQLTELNSFNNRAIERKCELVWIMWNNGWYQWNDRYLGNKSYQK